MLLKNTSELWETSAAIYGMDHVIALLMNINATVCCRKLFYSFQETHANIVEAWR